MKKDDTVEELLDEIDDTIEQRFSEDDERFQVPREAQEAAEAHAPRNPLHDARLDAILAEVLDMQRRVEALHHAWLAQQTLLRRHQFPVRWLLTILLAMLLTWVFANVEVAWGRPLSVVTTQPAETGFNRIERLKGRQPRPDDGDWKFVPTGIIYRYDTWRNMTG